MWLEMLIQGPKMTFWGVFTNEYYFLSSRLQKALTYMETRILSPYWSLSVLRCDLEAQ